MKDLGIIGLIAIVAVLSWRLYSLSNQTPVIAPKQSSEDEETSYWLNRSSKVKSDISTEHLSEKD